MAKRRNKAAKIRAAFEEMGTDASAKDVVHALAKQRVRVTPQQVYTVKGSLGKQQPTGESPYAAILAAKQLVDALGSVAKAKEALDVLAKLS